MTSVVARLCQPTTTEPDFQVLLLKDTLLARSCLDTELTDSTASHTGPTSAGLLIFLPTHTTHGLWLGDTGGYRDEINNTDRPQCKAEDASRLHREVECGTLGAQRAGESTLPGHSQDGEGTAKPGSWLSYIFSALFANDYWREMTNHNGSLSSELQGLDKHALTGALRTAGQRGGARDRTQLGGLQSCARVPS